MIEPARAHLKRETTKKGAPKNREEAVAAWKAAWEELSQEKIRAWIERIPRHIQEVIHLGGGNSIKKAGRDALWRCYVAEVAMRNIFRPQICLLEVLV
ncbi:hypothetical protein E4U19_008006 [Claviceps sp. Clav32 group G5]|nr:hypothetical protein E4U19_008006 [Claviceps sp. Clav32 group G5]